MLRRRLISACRAYSGHFPGSSSTLPQSLWMSAVPQVAARTSSLFWDVSPRRGFAAGGKSKAKSKSAGTPSSGSKNPAASAPAAATGPANNGRGIDGDFVFGVQDVTKVLPGGRQLFANVNLMFQRGAKIGVLGLNGSGKSSLLKILAGVDK
jgi:ABC-type multidrug transport system fused ATPase/permease subunit